MATIELKLTPQRSALLTGHSNELHVLVQGRAPDAPKRQKKRQALNLAVVIDKSGSMNGRPLAEALRCAHYIVDALTAQDRLSVVAYDDQVELVIPSTRVEHKQGLHSAIDSICCGGMTALFDGWQAGAEQALEYASGHLSRVLLLSDGCANRGETQLQVIEGAVRAMADKGVTTSTYGLGDGFNEDLMIAMANAGQGQSYYGESADDLMEPFQEEFSLMTSLCARQLRLSLAVAEGVQMTVMNQYTRDEMGRYQLPDLAYSGEAWALLKLRIPSDLSAEQGRDIFLLTATLIGEDLEGQPWSEGPESIILKALPLEAFQAIAEEPLVNSRLLELRAAELQEQAREAARRHDWGTVDELLAQAEQEAADNEWLQATVKVLRRYAKQRDMERFSKEARYKSSRMRNRLASIDENSLNYSVEEEQDMPLFLRRKQEQGKKMDDRPKRS